METIINSDKWPLIVDFTTRNWRVDNIVLKINTRLQEDLGIKGDDADEFIYRFAEAFNVDIANVDLSNYFTGNDFDFMTPIVRFFKREPVKKKKPLTLGDLQEAIMIGKLDDSIILNKE